MSSVSLFCTVSHKEASLISSTFANIPLHHGVKSLVILHTGKERPTTFGQFARRHSNVKEIHRYFGTGLDRAIEDGGFDQVSARNFAQEIAEASSPDWLMRIDADEVILNAALDMVCGTTDRYDLLFFDYHTLLPRRRYWYKAGLERLISGTLLLDPHLTTWRRELELRDQRCATSSLRFTNKSRHCNIRADHIPAFRIKAASGLFHLHLHCLLSKENAAGRAAGRVLEIPLPPEADICLTDLGLYDTWALGAEEPSNGGQSIEQCRPDN